MYLPTTSAQRSCYSPVLNGLFLSAIPYTTNLDACTHHKTWFGHQFKCQFNECQIQSRLVLATISSFQKTQTVWMSPYVTHTQHSVLRPIDWEAHVHHSFPQHTKYKHLHVKKPSITKLTLSRETREFFAKKS